MCLHIRPAWVNILFMGVCVYTNPLCMLQLLNCKYRGWMQHLCRLAEWQQIQDSLSLGSPAWLMRLVIMMASSSSLLLAGDQDKEGLCRRAVSQYHHRGCEAILWPVRKGKPFGRQSAHSLAVSALLCDPMPPTPPPPLLSSPMAFCF